MKTMSAKEVASPHKLVTCLLLKLYVAPSANQVQTNIDIHGLQLFLIQSIKRVDEIFEPVLVETCHQIEARINNGYLICNYLKSEIKKLKSPDDLFDLLGSLKLLLYPPEVTNKINLDIDTSGRPTHIEGNGIFGIFLRRILLACKLKFEAISKLFHELSLYSNVESSKQFTTYISRRQFQSYLHQKAEDIELRIGLISSEKLELEISEILR